MALKLRRRTGMITDENLPHRGPRASGQIGDGVATFKRVLGSGQARTMPGERGNLSFSLGPELQTRHTPSLASAWNTPSQHRDSIQTSPEPTGRPTRSRDPGRMFWL